MADDAGFERLDDAGFERVEDTAAKPAGSMLDYTPPKTLLGKLLEPLTDIPREAAATTRDTAASAYDDLWGGRDRAFQEQKGHSFLRGMFIDTPMNVLKTGRGLATAAAIPFAPLLGAARSAVGHPYSHLPGMDYDKAKEAVDTASMAIAPGRGRIPGAAAPLSALEKPIVNLKPDIVTPAEAPKQGALPFEATQGFEKLEEAAPAAVPKAEPTPETKNMFKAAAKSFQKILSPQTVSPIAGEAEASIRQAGGRAARDTEMTRAALEAHVPEIAKLDDAGRLQLVDYMETRSKGAKLQNPALQPIADTVADAMQQRRAKIEALPSTDQMTFIEDYYPHLWKDPRKAQDFMANFGKGTKEGRGANLKKRNIPTVADGIKAGLEPVSMDPIETTMKYVQNMDRFIATNQVFDEARAVGTVKYFIPGKQPAGYRQVGGRLGMKQTPASVMNAFAPEDWARIYNNFIDRGIHKNADWGGIYDTARNASNAITQLELGLSGFHAFTMANEAGISAIAKGVGEFASGQPVKGLKSMASAPTKFITNYTTGKKFEDIYLGKKLGAPDFRKVVDLGTDAGMRAKGMSHAADYKYTAMNSYWDSFKRGSLKTEMISDFKDIKGRPIVGTGKVIARNIGRVMQTVAKPLFEKYIPRVKNGAFYDTMQSWIEANPAASLGEQQAAARKIWNSIDNRFGEMVQDNLFWNKTLKQVAQLSLRSYSWTLGTIDEIGVGAARGVANPKRLSMASQKWDPRANYVIALPIWVASVNAAYQYLMTGKPPESIRDLLAGRTGGTAPGVGGRGEVEERAMLPGYQKDVYGWYHNWLQEARNKLATGPRAVTEILSNKNWRDDPIINPDDGAPAWLKQYWQYVLETFGPITVRTMTKGTKEGSEIGPVQQGMGLRPASSWLQDPAGEESMKNYFRKKDWQKKEKYERRQNQQYGIEE